MTRFDEIKHLLKSPQVSRDARRHWPAYQRGEIGPDWPLISWVAVKSAFTTYGEERVRLRNLIAKAFTPRRTERLRPRIEEITEGLLAELEARDPSQPVDLRADFAYRIPTQVICDLFGVPDEMREQTLRVIDAALDTGATPEQAQAHFQQMWGQMATIIAYRREHPGDDMTSELIAARDDESGSRLDEDELVSTLILMIGAGAETAVNLIAKATVELLTHPEQRELIDRGEVGWAEVVEETLRLEAPIMHMPLRYAVEDIELDGVLIKAGDAILPGFGAAGRDRCRHGADADVFDATRSDKEHLAFGYGVHFCIGAPLARLEGTIALSRLFDRFPDLRLAVPAERLEPQASFIANGHSALPIRLNGARPQAEAA